MSTAPGAARQSGPRLVHILIGLAAGAAIGLFFGDGARVLQPAADGFVRLLQMTVLPYLCVSIVANIGGLKAESLRTLGGRVALVLGGIWVLVMTTALLMPLTFPPNRSGAFFSSSLLEEPASLNLVDLYIPSNPFFALANNIVPAVVVFAMIIGASLIGLPGKQPVLDALAVASATISRAMRFVTRLTPLGVFAIAATAAGTLRVDEASRLQIYLVAYTAFGVLIAWWTLPGLVGALTPVPVVKFITAVRQPLLTAAIVGDLFIVLPALSEAAKELLGEYVNDESRSLPDVIIPIAYNFPHSGKLLTVSFVLFGGWFSDAKIDWIEYPRLAAVSIATLFGSVTAAIPFLLDLFRVPADTFQLFVASSVINARVGSMVAAMHLAVLAILGSCASVGVLRWRVAAMARYLAVTVLLTALVIITTRSFAVDLLGQPPATVEVLDNMQLNRRVESSIDLTSMQPIVSAPGTRLQAVMRNGVLRVGFLSDALPFAFLNAKQQLVGFDIELMHRLARDLGVRVVFVPVSRTEIDQAEGMAAMLARGGCDVVVGGLAITTSRASLMQLSSSYMSETLGFVVPDSQRRRFASWEAIRENHFLTVAMPPVPHFLDVLQQQLPAAKIVTVRSAAELFETATPVADAFMIPAERGSAWTLRYPKYAVVVPLPGTIKVPLAFALPRAEPDLAALINTSIALARDDGTIASLYDYWILGRTSDAKAPRWSVIRDVLHWVD